MQRYLPLLLLASSPVFAQDWNISGYGSLGYSYDDSDEVGNVRTSNQYQDDFDEGTWKHSSNAGIQLDYQASEQFSFTTQLYYEPLNPYSDLEDYVNLAFVEYTPNQDWDIKLGRQGALAYMVSDSRNIDFAHLWAYPVKEVYGYQGFNNLDGVSVTRFWEGEERLYSLSLQYGSSEFAYPRDSDSYIGVEAKHNWLASLRVSDGDWSHFAAISYLAEVSVEWDDYTESAISILEQIANAPSGSLPDNVRNEASVYLEDYSKETKSVRYYHIGTQYFDGTWMFQAELSKVDTELAFSPSGVGGYLMLGRTFDKLTPFGIVKAFVPDDNPRHTTSDWGDETLEHINQLAALSSNINRVDQHTLSLGVRYDMLANLAFKFQFDRVYVNEYGYGLWYVDAESMTSDTQFNVYTATLNYVF